MTPVDDDWVRGTKAEESAAWRMAMQVEHAIRPRLQDESVPRIQVTVTSETMKQLLIQEVHFQVAAQIDFRVSPHGTNRVHPLETS